MSLEQVKMLIERIKHDEAFKKRVTGVKDVDQINEIIKSEGFDCTTSDIKSFLNKYIEIALDDQELMTRLEKGCIAKGIPEIQCSCDMM